MASAIGQLGPTLKRMDYGRALKEELLMSNKSDLQVPYAQPLLDAVELFESLGVGYALIGGIAAMYYGRPRFTDDADFLIGSIGVPPMKIIGETPMLLNGMQFHLWEDERADEIIHRASEVEVAGRRIKVIEPHDLIAMKLRARRLKDDYDISQIVLSTPIDQNRLAQMVTPEQLAYFIELKKRS